MSDVVERAKAALEGLTETGLVIREPCNDGASYTLLGLAQHAARNAVYDVVPELVAEVEWLESTLFLIQEARIDYDAALRNREHAGVAAQRFVDAVVSALDGSDR